MYLNKLFIQRIEEGQILWQADDKKLNYLNSGTPKCCCTTYLTQTSVNPIKICSFGWDNMQRNPDGENP